MRATWNKVICSSIVAAALAGIVGYNLGSSDNSFNDNSQKELSSRGKDNAQIPRRKRNGNQNGEEQQILEQQLEEKGRQLEKYSKLSRLAPVSSELSKTGGYEVPINILERIVKEGKSVIDENTGTFYFSGSEGIRAYMPAGSAVGMGLTGGKVSPKKWNKIERDEKFREGIDFTLGQDSYKILAFGTPWGHSMFAVFDRKTGEVLGSTAVRGSLYDFGAAVMQNSKGEDVPLLWILGLDNALQRVHPDAQREILGPNFANFIPAVELAEKGIFGQKDEKGDIVAPFPHQYALTLTVCQAFGDGISGGIINTLQRVNNQGKIREENEPSKLEANYVSEFGIPTNSGLFMPRQPKPGVTIYLSPVEVGSRVREIGIDNNRAYFSVEITGDQMQTVYREFAPAAGYKSRWDIQTAGEINGIEKVLNTPANPLFDKEIKKLDGEK